MTTTQRYEVMGWVVSVTPPQRHDPNMTFMLRTRDNTEYRCECSFFGAQLHPGDTIYGFVQMTGERSVRFVNQPFVQVPVGEENVKICFVRALHGSGFGQVSAQNLYERLAELAQLANYARKRLEDRKKLTSTIFQVPGKTGMPSDKAGITHNIGAVQGNLGASDSVPFRLPGAPTPPPMPTIAGIPQSKVKEDVTDVKLRELTSGPDGVIAYLSDAAARFNKTNDPQIVDNLVKGTKLKPVQIEVLLRWWHQHRSLRRLHLFGLTNAEIKGCYKPLDEIYEICLTNPYRLPAIPLDKAEKIMASMQKVPSSIDIECGKIVRKMYEMQERMGWTCTPVWMLAKQFSTFHPFREILVKDYEVTIEHNSAYLPYAYKVETYVAEYIDARIKSTADQELKRQKGSKEDKKPVFENKDLPLPGGVVTPNEVMVEEKGKELSVDLPLKVEKGKVLSVEVPQKVEALPQVEVAKELPPPVEIAVPAKEPKEEIPVLLNLPLPDLPDLESCMYRCKTLDPKQKQAIQGALEHEICIIRGPAGSGKSKVIGEIVHNLQIREIPFLAVGFTGRAVARLEEELKCRLSSTMDRAIAKAAAMPPFKHLLIDESSMVAGELTYRFIRAFPGKYKITIVGDCNQLLPIAWSTFMKQLLACKRIPTYTLPNNHRLRKYVMSADVSSLPEDKAPAEVEFDRIPLENANALIDPNRDLSVPLTFKEGTNFNIVEGGIELIYTIVRGLKDAGFDKSRLTVLCPYNEYLDGLNLIFQNVYLEGAKKMVDTQKRLWSVGTRVMMLVNNYDINVMNGEDGQTTDITDEGVVVKFADGAEHTFKWESSKPIWKQKGEAWKKKKAEEGEVDSSDGELTIDQLKQSFAKTIFKAQGSETDCIIVFFPPRRATNGSFNVSSFLNINLLYTAITRTKLACWLVGSRMVIEQATCKRPPHRYENLCLRLLQLQDKEKEKVLLPYTQEEQVTVKTVTSPPEEEDMPQHDDFGDYPDTF